MQRATWFPPFNGRCFRFKCRSQTVHAALKRVRKVNTLKRLPSLGLNSRSLKFCLYLSLGRDSWSTRWSWRNSVQEENSVRETTRETWPEILQHPLNSESLIHFRARRNSPFLKTSAVMLRCCAIFLMHTVNVVRSGKMFGVGIFSPDVRNAWEFQVERENGCESVQPGPSLTRHRLVLSHQ